MLEIPERRIKEEVWVFHLPLISEAENAWLQNGYKNFKDAL